MNTPALDTMTHVTPAALRARHGSGEVLLSPGRWQDFLRSFGRGYEDLRVEAVQVGGDVSGPPALVLSPAR